MVQAREDFRTQAFEVWHQYDDVQDFSYLEQDGREDRLAAYKQGDFYLMGVVVAYYDEQDQEHTASLWGIESDSGADFLQDVERDLMRELWDHLQEHGIV